MPDLKITELPDATLPITSGVKFEAVQGGVNVKVDADDMPGGGGTGTVESVSGTTDRIEVDNTDPDNPTVDIDPAYDAVIAAAIAAAVAPYVSDVVSTSTAGGTITFDMNNQNTRGFYGSASFSTAKILALSNTTSAGVFIIQLNLTDLAAILTVPSDWKMTDLNFDGTDWTPPSTGEYIFGGKLINAVWYVNVAGPYS
jgi:hypothetical protein